MKRYAYLGALVAVFGLAVFAGTAVADDSTPASDTATPVAAAEPGAGDIEVSQSDGPAVGAEAVAAAESEPTTSSAEEAPVAAAEEPGTTTTADETPAQTDNSAGDHSTTTSDSGEPAAGGGENPVAADVPAATCPHEGVITGASILVGSTSATATFSIAAGCEVQMTLASFTMPAAAVSFPQNLFASSSGVFAGGGPYSLTVALPACYYQVDLIRGTAPSALGGYPMPTGFAVKWAWSSPGKVCETITPPVETVPPPGGNIPPVNTVTTSETTATTTTTTTTTTPTTTTPTTTTTAPTTTSGTLPTQNEVAGESAGNQNVLGAVAAAAHLPFTGLSLLLVAVSGIFLVLLGLALRGVARRGNAR